MEFGSHISSVKRMSALGAVVPAAIAAGVALFSVDPAFAQQGARSPASNQCAIYGAGFVAVQGTGTCVRIGGRVRIEVGGNRVTGNAYAPGGFPAAAPPFGAPSQAGDGLNRAHLRVEGPLSRSGR